ncbi:MAG TPA: ABC transporter permease [Cyclobacteriaceae bacterium]|nr:ABC transporter permease [Cyclobacteriaceae bacterium]
MLKNYILVALRTIRKHRIFSFINIFGLAVAMSICMGIIMLVADQMMVDRHNPNSNKIYRITSIPYDRERNGIPGNEFSTTSLPIRDELLNNYTGVEKAVRLVRGFGNNWMELEPNHDVNIPVSGFFADPEVLEVFNHELLYGDPATALVEPYSVVLTQKTAEKLFKTENPVGESIKVGKLGTYKITGVIKETENRSHIVGDAFASMATMKSLVTSNVLSNDLDNWHNWYVGWVYLLLEDGTTADDIKPHLEKISKAHYANLQPPHTSVLKYDLQNLLDIVPGRMMNNPIGPFMPWFIIYFLSGIAGIILITSCFNFTNLSIARSLNRAREIGVRKVTGASRFQLFTQFLSESVIISLFALVLAVVIIYMLRPFIVDLAFARFLKWDLSANYVVYGVFVVLAFIVGIIAGLFPASVLSGFQPVKVLKDLGNTKLMSKVGLRKTLLVAQFSLSMIFILTVIVLNNQMNLFLHNDNGFTTTDKLVIQKGDGSVETLKTELLKQPNVKSVSAVSHLPMIGVSYGEGFKKTLEDKEWSNMNYFSVDEGYLENMGLTLVAGKFFSTEAGASNKNFIVINEEAVLAAHLASPTEAIGQTLIMQGDSSERQVIGVVKGYHHEILESDLGPLALIYNPDEFKLIQVAYTGDFKQATKSVENAWSRVYPGLKTEIKDFKAELGVLYDIIFGTLIKVLGFVASLAIIISCLGLLGMATYTIETRKKEIAVRKILGSSDRSLIYILSKGYVSILLIALMISIPVAYFMNTFWLQNLAVHVTVDVWTILAGIAILAFFGLFTIGSQTIQATRVNPVDNLKSE